MNSFWRDEQHHADEAHQINHAEKLQRVLDATAPNGPRMPRLIGDMDLSKFIVIERAEHDALKKVLSAASFALEDLDAFLVGELGHEWSEHYGGTYEILEDLRTALDAAKGRKITVAEARKKAIDHLHRVDARLAEERKVEDTVTITRADYERLLADSERLDDVIELGLRVYHCLDGHWHVLPVGGNKAPDGGLDYWTSGRAALDAARRGKG